MDLMDYLMDKTAEATGTSVMPVGAPTYSDRKTSLTKTIPKVAEALEQCDGVSGEQVQKLPQAAPVKLRVGVTGKEAPTVATNKEAQYYALPSFSRYPLDSYAHVKQASVYFDENYKQMTPEMRWEYSQNLCKRASSLGIQVGPIARKYGGDGYANDGEFEAAMSSRVSVIKEAMHLDGLQRLKQCQPLMAPLDFAVALGEFDKVAGIAELYDSDVIDPFYTTFGEKKAEDDSAIMVSNEYISTNDLRRFARTSSGKLMDMFGADFVKEFRKDPVSITRSLPVDQKKVIIRLASSSLTDPTTT